MEQANKLRELAKDMSVLYVEDEKQIREETTEFLKKFFLSVDTARNGKEGLESFKAHRQDIVITDILMPVMEGDDMIAKIKEIDLDTPVIIISAYDFSDYASPESGKGVVAFLKKPVAYNDFVTTLCSVIGATKPKKEDALSALKQQIKALEERVAQLERQIGR